ncbi:DUF1559 family PulG-like putative transporter [Planctomicrobium piriforme]|uniref:DUF1559 domain-containing protein n=1 Tax=Planctomicrobium piriforme TaxID=1576369 RepID=A0A1I3CBM6_9PLAN|nr:DUF1559 domain-containing protein [Planctomicrobium piriforme]SFH71877.1 Protein of unknown function [Planctomicrobium piriforme]
MSNQHRRLFVVCGLVLGILAGAGWGYAQRGDAAKSPAELLPAETVLYLRIDGAVGHEEAFEKTAAYQALYVSGLMDVVEDLVSHLGEDEKAAGFVDAFRHVMDHGFVAGVAIDPPEPGPLAGWGTIVVPEAGAGVDLLEQLLKSLEDERIDVQQTKVQGRKVKYVKIPDAPVDLGWWKEGNHLVIGFGMNGIASTIAVADGKRPNLTANALYERYSQIDAEFEVTQVSWFDFKALREMFGSIPIPIEGQKDPVEVNKILDVLGLQNLEHFAALAGYRDESLWGEMLIEAPGERTGLLSLLDQPTFKLDDLPAIPLHHLGLAVSSIDWGKSYETVLTVARAAAELGIPDSNEKLDEELNKIEMKLGFKLPELLNSLGSLNCTYADSAQGNFGLGSVALVNVRDVPVLKACLENLLRVAQEELNEDAPNAMNFRQIDRETETLYRIDLPMIGVISPTISVDENWMVIGLIPQAVEAQRLRMDGTLFSWSIDEDLADALELLPEEMTSLSVVDPAATYKTVLGLAPAMMGLMEVGLRQQGKLGATEHLPVDMADFPPAELVTGPLFMNITVSTVDDAGVQFYSRQSLPAIPLLGATTGAAIATGAFTAAVPLLQNSTAGHARQESSVRLARLGQAVKSYAEDHETRLPSGTVPNAHLSADERLSWLVPLLPYLEQGALAREINLQAGWKAPENAAALSNMLTPVMNPAELQVQAAGYGVSQYVGLGGIGTNGPELAVDHPRAGAFGEDRITRLSDITDGTSVTVMISEASDHIGPWGAGGRSTVRAFVEEPYLNGPDGIGSSDPNGCQMVLVDGSVRSIRAVIDPQVMEALATIAGGEAIRTF